ncbi:MAG TPA: chemotaxis protein CheB [Gemmatimonadales bacterium]
MNGARSIAVLGTSWGGLDALTRILGAMPADFALPIVVVQHRGRDAAGLLGELLQDSTSLAVREVEDKEPIMAGTVHLAPPDYHLLVEQGHFSLSVDPPVRFSRPSIDVTFGSASDAYGAGVIGVVLTGANDDGARGLRCIVDRGGLALVQDPGTAESAAMPRAALSRVPEAEVVPLEAIASRLAALARVEEAA